MGKLKLLLRKYYKWICLISNIAGASAAFLGSYVMLEYASAAAISVTIASPMNFKAHILSMGFPMISVSILTIAVVWALLYILFNRVWLSGLLTSLAMGIISLINYYVALLHGMPLSFLSIRNFGTAMAVIGSYEITIDSSVVKILIMLGLLICFYLLLWLITRKEARAKVRTVVIRDLVLLLMCGSVVYFGYCSPNPIKPSSVINWLWTDAYSQYGYVACTVETLGQMRYAANMPDGYSEEKIETLHVPEPEEKEYKTPDVILILNETFYDLSQIVDLETDVPYLEDIRSIDGLISGYAVVPGNGGGTNSAEYELLTSNSLEIMPGITPFNILNMQDANSIVSHLEALGYTTLGTHSESPTNYSRNTGYSGLGFDNIKFEDQYTYRDSYHNRHYASDKCLYEHLTTWYEAMPQEAPRFMYMLTIQNHGGYTWNDPEHDLVHAKNDYGEYDDDVDEFLTSIYQSSQAFSELTDYFSKSDRPVIICMVGDHCPAFGREIVDAKYSDAERNLRLRKVPMLIWANYDLPEASLGTVSLNYVVPTLLDLANIQTSPYYQYQLGLKETAPILTSYGSYYDEAGNVHRYDSDEAEGFAEAVDGYFYLEYHNLEKNRDQNWYDPYD